MMKRMPWVLAMVSTGALLPACRSVDEAEADRPRVLTPESFLSTERLPEAQSTAPIHRRMESVLNAAEKYEIGVDVLPDTEPEPGDKGPEEVPPVMPEEEPEPDEPTEPGPPAEGELQTAPPEIQEVPQGSAQGYPIDAMVGQVNGRAIYASRVLEPIDAQLAALGRQLPPREFEQRAQQIIGGTLEQLVADALILGEAGRRLTEQEWTGLNVMIERRREELIRKYGRGSLAVAEAALREQTGKTLEQTLQDYRQQRLVQHQLQNQLLPKINVTRRDVERYYREHETEFNPDATRTLRLIRVPDESDATQVAQQLESGASFEAIAASDINTYRPGSAGLMDPVSGPNPFSDESLNEAILALEEGQHAGPTQVGNAFIFARLEDYQKPESTPLEDVQLDIEERLRQQQYRQLSADYRRRLFEEGSYNSLQRMTEELVAIAKSRYAAQ